MVIDPAVWDIQMLNCIATECRIHATPTPDGFWFNFPPQQRAVLRWVVTTMSAAIRAKIFRGIPEGLL